MMHIKSKIGCLYFQRFESASPWKRGLVIKNWYYDRNTYKNLSKFLQEKIKQLSIGDTDKKILDSLSHLWRSKLKYANQVQK